MKRNKKEIKEYIKKLNTVMELKRTPILGTSRLETYNGFAFRGKIFFTLTKPVIENWKGNKNIGKFIIAHEMVHLKYNDPRTILKKWWRLTSIERKAVKFLSEMRANIEGVAYLQSLEPENFDFELVLREIDCFNNVKQQENGIPVFNYDDGLESLNLRMVFLKNYPSPILTADYLKRYDAFTNEAKMELLNMFYNVLASDIQKDKEDFIKTVSDYFSKHYTAKEIA